jgi:hypothetical protein
VDELLEMKLIPVAEIEVINTVTFLKRKIASGYDGISNKILIHCVNLISKPSAYICNSLLTSGIYPDRCQYAVV